MKNISLAIIEVMKEIEWVAKGMVVWEWTKSAYKWVADKDVKQALRDSMTKNWLSLLPIGVESKIQVDRWEQEDFYKWESQGIKSKQSIFTEVTTKYLLLHTSGESIELAWYWQGVDTQDKGAGKATTYALKNTLLNMFLIPTGVDTDNTHSDEYDVPAKKTYTTTAEKKLFNYKDLKQCIADWTDTEILLSNYIKDNGFTLSGDMKTCLRTYCDSGELIEPVRK